MLPGQESCGFRLPTAIRYGFKPSLGCVLTAARSYVNACVGDSSKEEHLYQKEVFAQPNASFY